MRHFRDTSVSRPLPGPSLAHRRGEAAVTAAPALRVDIASSAGEIRAMRPAWEALARVSRDATPFQDYEWADAWIRAREAEGEPVSPLVVLVSSEDRPLLLWPMQIDRHAGMRRLTWLTAPALQYGGVLLADMPDAARRRVFDAGWRAIRNTPVDYVDLRLVPEDSPLADFLRGRCRTGCGNHAYLVDLSGSADWRAYELSLPRSARRSRKKRLNRMRRAGEMRFVVHRDSEAFSRLATVAVAWKREWLHAHGISGALPERREFIRLLHALGNGHGREEGHAARWVAAELSLDGRPVAIDIGAVRGRRFHSFLSAYDADRAELSPGKVALWLMLRWCKENGIDIYDMLANAAPYKEDWATRRIPLRQFIRPRTAGGLAYVLWASHLRGFATKCYRLLPDGLRNLASGCISGFRA